MRNPCKECDYYHKENNTCQSKKCCTGGGGYITWIDRLFCKPYKYTADRKTENSSENPNNCKDKPQHGYMWTCSKCGLEVHSDYGKCPRCGELKDEPQTERSE